MSDSSRLVLACAALSLAVASSFESSALADPVTSAIAHSVPEPAPYPLFSAPPGFHVETGPIRGLYMTGGSMLAVSYATGVLYGAAAMPLERAAYTAIPIAGPFLAATARHRVSCQATGTESYSFGCFGPTLIDAVDRGVLYADGVIQAAGAVLLVTGLAVQRKRVVRDRAFTVLPVPVAVRSGAGVGLTGTF